MTKLPVVPYSRLRDVAEAAGFELVRRKGSHNIFRRADGKTAIIPDHGSNVIVRSLLREILRELELTPDEYQSLLRRR
jgi:predicted RNA binding protein YcfA (HicA-like mRNA interferase family)